MPSSNFCAGRSKLSPRRLSCSGGISQGIKVVPVHKRNQKKTKLGGQKKKNMGGEEKNFQKCPPSRIKAKSLHSDVSRDVGT